MKKFIEKEFIEYRNSEIGKSQRFWQALRNYMDVANIFVIKDEDGDLFDTFYLGDN